MTAMDQTSTPGSSYSPSGSSGRGRSWGLSAIMAAFLLAVALVIGIGVISVGLVEDDLASTQTEPHQGTATGQTLP